MNFTSLCLELTNKCNAECDICYMSCSPESDEVMPVKQAINYIEQASEIDGISSVSVTGGEPFILYETLLGVIETANQCGLSTSCGTNGFWANTEKHTIRKMDELEKAGLNHISISVDEFHLKYVPIDNIRNILRAARKRRFSVSLTSIITRNSQNAKDIIEALGEDIIGYSIMEFPCLPIGKAIDIIDQGDFIFNGGFPQTKCFMNNSLTIKSSGLVFPCLLTPALCLGSLYDITLVNAIDEFRQNVFCRVIEQKGYEWFVSVIRGNNLPIILKDRYVSLCDLCHTLFGKKEHMLYFEPFMAKI